MNEAASQFKYTHYVPPAKDCPQFPANKKHTLVSSLEQLREICNRPITFVAWDTETSGLNADEDFIVGFSFAFDSEEGFYVPVKHAMGISLGHEALEIFYNEILVKAKMTFVFNMRFDFRMMRFAGFDMSMVKYYDVSVGVWLSDTNVKMPSLKFSEKHFLGWAPETFAETTNGTYNFYYLDPVDGYKYASADAVGTMAVCHATVKFFKESELAGRLDNEFLYPLMQCEESKIEIDVPLLEGFIIELNEFLKQTSLDIFKFIGYPIKINSSKQLGDALQRLGIHTGEYTKTGQMKVDIKTIEALNIKEPHPMLEMICNYSRALKMVNSYVTTLRDQAIEKGGKLRFAYITNNVPCLTESAMVVIKGKGLISIKDVVEGDFIHTQYGWKKVLWNHKKWSETVYRLELKDGNFLEGTGRHPVLVNLTGRKDNIKPEWSGITSLEVGEQVLLNAHCVELGCDVKKEILFRYHGKARKLIEVPKFFTKELAQLLGFIDGDGSIVDDGVKLCFNSSQLDVKEYYCSLMESIFNLSRPAEYLGKDHTISVKYCGVILRDFFSNLNGRQKREDRVSKYIREDSELWLSYLAGLWDSDGTLCKSGKYYNPRVKTNKKGLMYDVKTLLEMLGIDANLSIVSKEDLLPRYEVCCSGDRGRALFRDFIGPLLKSQDKKQRVGENLYNDYYDMVQSKVESVFQVQGAFVYDIEVEDVHEYIANGIVTHNTGRLSSGSDKKNPFFAKINVQSIPKPHPKNWFVHKYNGEELKKNDCVLMGFRFSLEDESDYVIEGADPHLNIRSAFLVDDDEYWVSMDYAAQELRVIANLTGEPSWVNTFITGGDLHKNQAINMWGQEAYDKEKRKRAKVLNFGMAYGMSGHSLAKKFNVSVDEGDEIVNMFWKAAPRIKEYQTRCVRRARKDGVIYNYFHRPRRVKAYFNSSEGKMRAFGARTVNNCYSPDTEFLTDSGWRIAYDITPYTRIAYYDEELNGYRFCPAGERFSAKVNKAYGFKSMNTDLLVTNNHRMYAKVNGKNSVYKVYSAESLSNQSFFSTINAPVKLQGDIVKSIRTPIGEISMEDFAEFVGYLATDGTIGYDKRCSRGYVQLFQSKEEVVKKMQDLNSRMGNIMHEYVYDYETTRKGVMHRFTISSKEFADYMVEFYGGRLGVEKSLPDWFMSLDRELLKITLFAAIDGDGSKCSKNGYTFYGSSKEFAEQMQLVAMGLGYRTHIRNQMTKQGANLWRVEISVSQNSSICDKRYNYYTEDYEEDVEFNCFSVPTGLLVVRRNGKISVSGNTVIQSMGAEFLKIAFIKLWKNVYNGEFKGRSRFLTTVHDEVNSAIKRNCIYEAIAAMRKCMEIKFPNWPVPIITGLDIGDRWGRCFPFKYNDHGILVPDAERVHESGDADEDDFNILEDVC